MKAPLIEAQPNGALESGAIRLCLFFLVRREVEIVTKVPPRARILVADDTPDIQRLLALILNRAGADVSFADDGLAAYQKAVEAWRSDRPFDIILMNVRMPVLDGCAASRKLRDAGYPGTIIALTADATANSREKCTQAGCDDHLTKPFSREELLRLVSSYVDGW